MLKNSKNKGITLIALVITIIVLLILAGISISMLSGDNSILRKATEAKEKSETAGAKEKIQLSTMSAIADKTGQIADATLRSELKKNLSGVSDNDIMGNEKYGWQVKIGTKAYSISHTGEVNEAFWEEVKDSNGNVTEIRRVDGTITGLKIGDIIGYSAIDGVNSENRTITSLGTVTGLGEGNNQTIEIEAGTWKLLGVENGKLKIISDIVGRELESGETSAVASKVLKLQGKIGYQNAEDELNRICSLYGKGKYAVDARSITIEDINKITGYDPEHTGVNRNKSTENGEIYKKNTLSQYGNRVTYFWKGDYYPKYTFNTSNDNLSSTHNNGFYFWDAANWKKIDYSTNPDKICTLISTSYSYYPETLTDTNDSTKSIGIANSSAERNLLFNDLSFGNSTREYYWLASRSIHCNTDYVRFGMQCVGNGQAGGYIQLASSHGGDVGFSAGLRPIVYLKSDIKLKKDNNGIWQFLED